MKNLNQISEKAVNPHIFPGAKLHFTRAMRAAVIANPASLSSLQKLFPIHG
jgi:hypothetical protein